MSGRAAAYFLLCFASALFFLSYADDSALTPSQLLGDDDDDGGRGNLISTGGRFELGFFSPKGSSNRYIGIWYHSISDKATKVWVANGVHPVPNRSGRLFVTADGRLVLADGNSTVFWSSGNVSTVAVGAIARLQDDGNLVVKDGSDTVVWQSFDFPTDTILPGMKMGWNRTSGHNISLRAWTNESDPTPGNFVMGMDLNGVPQELVWNNMVPFWRLGPWNGQYMGGAPEVIAENLMDYAFVVNSQMFVYWYALRDPLVLARITLSSDGHIVVWAWLDEAQSWISQADFPRDVCDYLNSTSSCGPYSLCSPTVSPTCACLEGFRPKNQKNWDLRVWSDGCVRKTELNDCRTDTVGFFRLRNAKLPDTSRATVDWSMINMDDCKALCLKDCSCMAYARANISGSGSGCIIWTHELIDIKFYNNVFGQELYLKLAARDIPSRAAYSRRRRVVLIVLVPLSAAFVLICAGGFIWYTKRRNTSEDGLTVDEGRGLELDLPLLDFSKIVDATNNFSTSNILGEGGFGLVYKGNLGEDQEIAVKRLSKTSTQGVDEFKNEVMLIAKLQHRNLVRLFGCCIQGGERILVYEYMPNGSLDSFLFDKTKSTLLDWQTRYDIIVGIARGLLYLHHDSRFKIIHRDLKASNILLDKGMNPKISDFGMARIFGSDETEVNTRRVVGTYGYMSPEYIIDGIISVKSDIFSFGVLILEIISGKRSKTTYYSESQINLLGCAWKLWKAGEALKLVDETLGTSFPTDDVLRCIKIGLLCVQERPGDRPTMPITVKMLGGESAFIPDPKQPGFFNLKNHIDSDSSTKWSSRNNVSITLIEGR
ncbi:receptor-like serine/threonine-protein kinase SD1-8 [Zingiber officinale]|uniref:receptor-like serine/threonine-protein kinase SD1-8 n=1 Tax=Zingiber officinale TaxID=94328 RepID=UPI001C4BF8E0|nr:receptor-like serine/threonine-protein kinase SD1-8 [Zingiber officinale]